MQEFALRLKAARLNAGFQTAASLADQMGISRERLFHWESGYACPKMLQLVHLCNTLNVEPNQLVPARRASPMPRMPKQTRAGSARRIAKSK